jgi:hypothetical protein
MSANIVPFFREPSLEIQALRDLAKDKPCLVRTPVCNGRTDTTVWAHSNQQRHGKGIGKKAHDCFGALACSACHDFLDNKIPNIPHEQKVEYFEAGRDRTELYLWREGLICVKR